MVEQNALDDDYSSFINYGIVATIIEFWTLAWHVSTGWLKTTV